MQESRLLRDAFAGIVRDAGFFDLPVTSSKRVDPPQHIQAVLREHIAAVRSGETVKLFHCEPFGYDCWGYLELTPNANGIFIQWYTNIREVVSGYGAAYGPWLFEEDAEFVVTSLYHHLRLMHRSLIDIHQKMGAPLELESELLDACGLPDHPGSDAR